MSHDTILQKNWSGYTQRTSLNHWTVKVGGSACTGMGTCVYTFTRVYKEKNKNKWTQWPTCIMMSCTRAGVKLRRHAVWGFHTPLDKHLCNLWSIVAVATVFACIDHKQNVFSPNWFLGASDIRNISASMQSYVRHLRVPITIATTALAVSYS